MIHGLKKPRKPPGHAINTNFGFLRFPLASKGLNAVEQVTPTFMALQNLGGGGGGQFFRGRLPFKLRECLVGTPVGHSFLYIAFRDFGFEFDCSGEYYLSARN